MKYSRLILLFLILISCKYENLDKDPDPGPCMNFPCEFDYSNYDLPLHRVALFPDYREGIWLNIKKYTGSQDSIIFHNDGTWSRTNSPLDFDHLPYEFDYWYLISRNLNYVNPLPGVHTDLTLFNDTTGVFSILYKDGLNDFQAWDHYIKIK